MTTRRLSQHAPCTCSHRHADHAYRGAACLHAGCGCQRFHAKPIGVGDLDAPATVTGRDGVAHSFASGHDAIRFACERLAAELVRRSEADDTKAEVR